MAILITLIALYIYPPLGLTLIALGIFGAMLGA